MKLFIWIGQDRTKYCAVAEDVDGARKSIFIRYSGCTDQKFFELINGLPTTIYGCPHAFTVFEDAGGLG